MIENKYKKEIAAEYNLKPRTFRNRLKRYNLVIERGLVSPRDQKKIYDRLGYPEGIEEDDYDSIILKANDSDV